MTVLISEIRFFTSALIINITNIYDLVFKTILKKYNDIPSHNLIDLIKLWIWYVFVSLNSNI